jgi:NAD(P)-dependent dehydrogenase (short-subunit alcohol dehydrogenase family)
MSHPRFCKVGRDKYNHNWRNETTLLSTKEAVEAQYSGVSVLALIADISDQKAVNAALTSTKNTFRAVDILVSNAENIPDILPLATTPIDEFSKGLDVNVKGGLILAQALLTNAADNPILMNIGTAAAHVGPLHPGMGAYSVSKLATVKMLEFVAVGDRTLEL